MTECTLRGVGARRRRAVVAVQVAIALAMLLGFAALTIDIGALYNVKSDLQRAADASALAAASAYITDEMLQIRMGTGDADTLAYVVGLANARASAYSEINPSFGTSATHVQPEDILTGWINLSSSSDTIHINPQPFAYNAVQVVVNRSAGGGEGSNEPVELFFAPVFGRIVAETGARAVAVFDDRFSGFVVGANGANVLPFTIHENAFDSEMAGGGDQYGYDDESDLVFDSPDGIREIRLYPYPLSGDGYEEGDGNFGVLNIGSGNQGLLALRDQITDGVPPEDFEAEVGTSELTFYDDSGDPVTYEITGSPGLDAGLTDAIEQMVGEEIAFFLHNDVILSGANAIYTITQMRFGRLMDIRLTGPPDQRGLFIQPISYAGGGVQIDPDAPSSGGLVGRTVLAR